MRIPTRALTISLTLATVGLAGAAGCSSHSKAGSSAAASRTIDVTMTDNAFQPAQLTVSKGETVKLRFKNTGAVRHEATIGDEAKQKAHQAEMTANTGTGEHGGGGGGGEHGDDVSTVTVEPGQSGDLTHTFSESTSILIGCHEPGHYEAGMKATVAIT